ncbi:hypothetical protein HD554DRAFT_2311936 [Boletus coccyginus]|nr:hypothetical protein HD554DRAFT_2311936 [Boletus coccyginus]
MPCTSYIKNQPTPMAFSITSITQIVCDIFTFTILLLLLVAPCLFKRFLSQLFCLQPKLRQRRVGTPRANTAVTHRESNSVRRRTRRGSKSRGKNVQPSTGTVPETIEEVERIDGNDQVPETPTETEVQTVQPSTDTIPENVDEVEECDDADDEGGYDDDEEKDKNIPKISPYDLERKTHIEMMIERLYVAVADNDLEIAALRTRDHKKFTHIVRVVFDPLAHDDNIAPSSWSSEEIYHDGDGLGPYELRLACPALTRHYSDGLTALKEKQLLAARNYITDTMPSRNEDWDEEKESLAFSILDECEDPRVLIVGPTDRSVDVLTVLVCYMAFLTGMSADNLLLAVKRLPLVHRHWASVILGRGSVDMASAVAKQKW